LSDAQSLHVASQFLAIHANDSAVATVQNLNQRAHASEDSWPAFDLALVYLLSGEYEKAISQAERYNNSLNHGEAKHESPDAWTVIGIAAAHLNQQERSVNALQHAATLGSGDEEHWLNLTLELMEMNRYANAISAVQDGLAANPKSYALHLRLGAAHLAAGHYADAEAVFKDLVSAGDPLPTGYVGLAQVLMRTGRAEEAAAELNAAEQKLGPTFLISYFQGLAFDRAGKPQPALSAFQKAVQLNPNNPEAHLSLGRTELALGRAKDAITELQETLRLDPNNQQAKRLLSKAYARAGDAKHTATLAEAPASGSEKPEVDLLGDFFVPQLQMPSEHHAPQSGDQLDPQESKP
jgi:tetratricopeptide (TPR) repeat protein